MINRFDSISDLTARDIIRTATAMVRQNTAEILKQAFRYLFPLALLIMMVRTSFDSVIMSSLESMMLGLSDNYQRIENVPLFDLEVLALLSILRHIAYGALIGLGAIVISRTAFRPAMDKKKSGAGGVAVFIEKDEKSSDLSEKNIGRTVFYSSALYLPMAVFLFLSDMYRLPTSISLIEVGVGNLLDWALLLLNIAYIPLVVMALPFITEAKMNFRNALYKSWDYYIGNFLHIAISVIAALFISNIFSYLISFTLQLAELIVGDIFGLSGIEGYNIMFLLSFIQVVISALLYITSVFVPLIGYAFYYLFITSQDKIDLMGAVSNFKSRVTSGVAS
jgi:hypothetical protein